MARAAVCAGWLVLVDVCFCPGDFAIGMRVARFVAGRDGAGGNAGGNGRFAAAVVG